MLKLAERTLVYRIYQLTPTLPLRAPAETVEGASRTVEDGGRKRLWSGSEPKPVSANQMHYNGKSLERVGSVTGEVVLCSGLVDDGGAHRIIAGDTWNPVILSCRLRAQHHGHALVTYTHVCITIQQLNQ